MKIKLIYFFSFFFLISLVQGNISENCLTNIDCIKNNVCYKNKCHHKKLFPLDIDDVIGFISIMIGSAISNSGGIGGGGLYIPSLIVFLKFYTHEAIPISKLMVFVGAVTAFMVNLKLKHPIRGTTAIDYNVVMLIVPFLIYGTVIGVLLNQILPSILILTVLCLVLIYNTIKTFKRAINFYKVENEEKLVAGEQTSIQAKEVEMNKLLVKIEITRDQRIFQTEKFKYMFLAYISMLVLSLLRGSDKVQSIIGVKKCSIEYWILLFVYLPIGLLITYKAGVNIREENRHRIEIGFPYDKYDIIWRKDLLYKYPVLGFFAGVVAGSVGIGGGLILGPLLIEMGVNPIISTVTSNFLVLFTSSSTSIQFSLAGMMNVQYAAICTVFSMAGSLIGTLFLHYILLVFKRESILVFTLFFVLLLSSIILPIYSFTEISTSEKFLDFNSLC